jgi:hypothetical protein
MCILGASIHAWKSVNRHIVTLEEDKAIFDALIAPLVRAKASSSALGPSAPKRSQDPDNMEIVPSQITRRRQSK